MRPIVPSAAIVLVGVALVLGAQAQRQDSEPAPTKDRPLSELDLRKFGYERYTNTHARWRTFLDFTDANHAAIAWLTPDDRIAAAKTGIRTPTPAHLHVLILDAVTGDSSGPQSYATPSYPVRFSGLRDGRFLTCTGNVLHSYSSQFEVIREQDLPNERGCLDSTNGHGVSPSRKRLLLSFPIPQPSPQPWPVDDMLLDIETFAPISTWRQDPKTSVRAMSDDWLVGSCDRSHDVCIRRIDQPWQPFPPAASHIMALQFVDDETLAIQSGKGTVVATADGRTLFQMKLPQDRFAVQFVTSSGGKRFAVIEDTMRGLRSEPLDMYPFQSNDRVAVYSLPDRRAIYTLKLKGTSPWSPWAQHLNQLSLSPDGRLLAVVSDNILRIYRLPGE